MRKRTDELCNRAVHRSYHGGSVCSLVRHVFVAQHARHVLTCCRSLKGITQRATAILLAAILVMWASTVAYWIATLLAAVKTQSILREMMSQMLDKVSRVQSCVSDPSSSVAPFSACQAESFTDVSVFSKAYAAQQCTGTAALTVNVSIPTYSWICS